MNSELRSDRRPVKSRSWSWINSMAVFLAKHGVSPNSISVASVFFSLLVPLGLFSDQALVGFIVAFIGVVGRLLCNVIDGLVAIEGGLQTPLGPLYNEFPDRISDTIIIVSFAGAFGFWSLGWAVSTLAAMTAFVRAFGAQCGAGVHFNGPMAKGPRMFVVLLTLTIACVLELLFFGPQTALHIKTLVWVALWIMLVGTVLTIVNRTLVVARALTPIQEPPSTQSNATHTDSTATSARRS